MPGETEDLAPGSWRGAWAPKLNTSAAVAGWPGGGPGLLPPLCRTLTHKQKHINMALRLKTQESKHDTGEKGENIFQSDRTDLLPPAGAAGAGLGWQLGG